MPNSQHDPTVKARIAIALLESGVAALTITGLAKITGLSLQVAHHEVTELRNLGLVDGKNCVGLTGRGTDFATRHASFAPKKRT